MIAVTFALPAESAAFLSLLDERSRDADSRIVRGRIGHHEIAVLHTGVGEAAARENVTRFLKAQTPRLLISAGFAGALSERRVPGDLLLADNFSTGPRAAAEGAGFQPSKFASTGAIVDHAVDRRALAARESADAVEMETATIASLCQAAGVPFLGLRVISDTPAHPLPAPPDVLFDIKRQRTSLPAVALYLLRHPLAVPRFIRFTRQIAVARETLARGLVALLRSDSLHV